MARFNGRAPYRISVPSVSKNSLPLSVMWRENGLPTAALRMRCCTVSSSISMILRSSSLPRGLNTTMLSKRFTNPE